MLFKTYNSYHFFRANQQEGNFKFYSWTQHDFYVNRRYWHILLGNEKEIAREDCLNRLIPKTWKIDAHCKAFCDMLKNMEYFRTFSGAIGNKIYWCFS